MLSNTALCTQWAASRKRLFHALDAYEAACNSLGALGVQAGTILEDAQPGFLQSIDAELFLLPRKVNRIYISLDVLKKLRNDSTKLVPISRLPFELLASVFSIAIHSARATPLPCVHSRRETPLDFANTISSVSSYWRHVALGTPKLWADITLTRTGGPNHAAIWLERSRPCPLIFRCLDENYSGDEEYLVDLIGRHSSRFKSLVLRSDNAIGRKVLYNACVQYSDESVNLDSLAVSADEYRDWHDLQDVRWPPKPQMDRLFKSVRTLYVKYRLFDDWTSEAFRGLTRLSLICLHPQALPTCEELLVVLRASPGLCLLELSTFLMSSVPPREATPVRLERLETVWLQDLQVWFARWLLEAIIPHSDGLTLTLFDIWEQDRQEWVFDLPLSIPDIVKTLYIGSDFFATLNIDVTGLLKAHPPLKTLALKRLQINLTGSDSSQHPMLVALDVYICEVMDTFQFKSMVARHSIRRLRMTSCGRFANLDELVEMLPGTVISEEPGDFLKMYSPFE